jgi:O-antigen/teichoic acid export membrane protein
MALRRLLYEIRGHVLARVSKNAIALLVAQVGARAMNLALIALVTRVLGVAGLGRYLLAMTAQAIALSVADLGLNTYTTREFSRDGTVDDAETWGTVLGLKLLAAMCGVLLLNAVVVPLSPGRQGAISIVSWSLLPDAFNAIATARIKARQRMEISGAINLGIRVLYALAGGGLIWLGYDEHALLAAYGGASLLGSCVFFGVLSYWCVPAQLKGFLLGWRGVLRESVPFAMTGLVAMLYTRTDLLILSSWQGDAAAGLYGAAYRLWEALGMIPSSFLDALFPELSRASDRAGDDCRLRTLYRRGKRITYVVVALLMVPAQLLARLIVTLLYGGAADTQISAGILRVLLLAFPFTYLYLLNGHTLYAAGRQRRVTAAMVAVTAVNALCNALAVPVLSYWGAALAKLASEALLFFLLQGMVRQFVLYERSVEKAG